MTAGLTLAAQAATDAVGTGEAVAFWVLGPLAVAGGLGMIFARNAVHSALWLVLSMLCLGVLYMVQQAPFLGFVQIIVYTGAIMMLFLFVLMLVGRDSSDSVVEVLRGQRLAAGLLGVGFAALLAAGLARALVEVQPAGLAQVNAGNGNVVNLGRAIFTDYLFPFELTSALLITAAIGAMVLAFVDKRSGARRTQRELVEARLRGEHARPSPLPGPGVFATASSVAVPALLPDGSVAPESLSEIIESTSRRRLDADIAEVADELPGPDAHALAPHGPERTAADQGGAGRTDSADQADSAVQTDSAAQTDSDQGSAEQEGPEQKGAAQKGSEQKDAEQKGAEQPGGGERPTGAEPGDGVPAEDPPAEPAPAEHTGNGHADRGPADGTPDARGAPDAQDDRSVPPSAAQPSGEVSR
ncbi:NADH:ubiquinone oxidoreductase subunit 6 (chain J) [Streptoalloteichus hindustanus]|uniref:NADH-quinone oxidoreductase subunit J n=1 Tax=Streptoalloteichus hindustanus TaxID=2017 RepID=A0A1M4TP50_STRHI|nr:NADH:ubiquinone oxidoreductase subunit 6 (chain J) [Streptoalloteichus hindustanus]